MDLFKIVGRIAIEGADEARNELTNTENQAKKASSKMGTALKKIGDQAVKMGKVIVKGLAAGAAGISFLTKSAIDAYADYEQLVGGVETLFKDSSDKVVEYANNAYKTAGLSANNYMETVTSFSASLLQGLGGDTDAAAEIANQAIVDMSDNANKMGTSMEMIQNAYQGFAKQNYTMLDNLKLGYGGTATEMARLINDSGVLGDSMTVTADTVNSVSFDKMIEAIHVIQTEMGITGTTSLEAATTIQGSMSSLKASWTNVLVGLADDTQDFGALLDILTENFVTVVGNVLPRIKIIFNSIPKLIEGLTPQIPALVQTILPGLIEGAIALMNGIVSVLPEIIQIIVDQLPQFIDGFMQIFVGLAENLGTIVAPLLSALPEIADAIVNGIFGNLNPTASAILIALATTIGVVTAALKAQAIVQGVKAAMNKAEVTSLGALIAAKWADAAATMAALAPYLLIAAAIAALIAVIVLLVKNWDKVKEVAATVWESIKATWESVANWFKTNVIDPLVNFFTGLWESITTIWENIKAAIQVALMFIVELLTAWFDLITLPWQFIWQNFGDTLTAIWETMKQYVSDALNAISETIANVMDAIKTTWDNIWTAISEFLTPIIETIKSFISSAFNSIKTTIDTIMNAIKTVISNVWNNIKSFFSNIIENIKTNVSDKFDAIKDKITTTLTSAKDNVVSIFTRIKDSIKEKIEGARDFVKSAIDKIKSFFNFTWSLPHLKLPHVSISGSFSLVPPSVPHFSVSWYAKGGILTEPTIFGYNPETGRVKVGGEAGDEAVAPIDTLLGYIRTAVGEQNAGLLDSIDRLIEMLAEYLPQLLNKDSQLVLDTGVLVGQTANAMNNELGNIYSRNERGG